jgi:hypothetical protein
MKSAKQTTREITGAIVRYTSNKHNDIDGLVVDQQGDLVDVKFPPHTARFVRDVAADGDSVHLVLQDKPQPSHRGYEHPKHKLHLASIENTSTHQQFSVESEKPPHPAETGSLVSFTIPKPEFTRSGKKDEITGVIFEGKYIHLHPEEYETEEDVLESAVLLRVKAKKRTADAGFVNAAGYTVYHAYSLQIGEN